MSLKIDLIETKIEILPQRDEHWTQCDDVVVSFVCVRILSHSVLLKRRNGTAINLDSKIARAHTFVRIHLIKQIWTMSGNPKSRKENEEKKKIIGRKKFEVWTKLFLIIYKRVSLVFSRNGRSFFLSSILF